jgi:hypothetical protein
LTDVPLVRADVAAEPSGRVLWRRQIRLSLAGP